MLYGRDHDCAALMEMLSEAQHGHSSALVLRGEAGVGKTALLDWMAAQAQERNMRLLRCQGVESETGLPFAGLHELLRFVLPTSPNLPPLQQEALNSALGLSASRGTDPFLVAVGTLSLLAEVADDDGGLLCIVDDAHWLDPSSADALRFVARRLHAEGIALVFAVREPDQALFPSPGLNQRFLTGLDPGSAAELLLERAPTATESVQGRLIADLAGNPLAIIEVTSALSTSQLSGREPLPDPMPSGGAVERLYAERVAALSEPAQRMLLLAATADTDDIAFVLGVAESMGIPLSGLDEAEASGLITAQGVLRFKHPLARSAVYLRSSFSSRRQAHRAMAALLVDDTDLDRRAWHLGRAATGTDDELADLLERSADRAQSRGGPAGAADRWHRSAELSSSGAAKARRLIRGAESCFHAAQPERARALISLAEPYLSTPSEIGRSAALLGDIEMRHGMPEAAYHLLLRGASALAADNPKAALEALVLAGEAATFIGDPRLTTQVGALAVDLGSNGSVETESMIELLVGLGKLFEGNWSEGARILAGLVDASVAGGDYPQVLRSGRAALYLGRLPEARSIYARAADHARATSSVGALTTMLDRLAYIDFLLGRLADAEAHASEGLALANDLRLDSGVAVSSLALVTAYRGEDAACRAHVDQTQEMARSRQLRMIGASGQWALGVLELGAGRPGEALRALLTVASEAEGHPGILRWATPDLVEAAARSGVPEASREAVERLEAWADASQLAIPQAALSRCRGLLTTGDEAIGHFESALAHDDRESRPLERARIELLLGETLRRGRQRSRARVHLRNSLVAFERLAAHPWAERARVELRASGESTARRDPSNFEQLTPQELQIAQYAADGESNADIATKLFLSRRTVEYHLAKVFTKLSVTSRRDLVGVPLSSG